MQVSRRIGCQDFPCADVTHECYVAPNVNLTASAFTVAMISEAAPPDPKEYFYARGRPLFARTTVQAFRDAGANISSVRDITRLGVYLTTAVKCAKTAYGIKAATVKECSFILEKELGLFPNLRVVMLMGDVAIKALNCIAKRAGEGRVIPAGSTYKIRKQVHSFKDMRVFPSYLQAGPSFFIEKSKRQMIAEDIRAALALAQ
jgi:hypothetical protein